MVWFLRTTNIILVLLSIESFQLQRIWNTETVHCPLTIDLKYKILSFSMNIAGLCLYALYKCECKYSMMETFVSQEKWCNNFVGWKIYFNFPMKKLLKLQVLRNIFAKFTAKTQIWRPGFSRPWTSAQKYKSNVSNLQLTKYVCKGRLDIRNLFIQNSKSWIFRTFFHMREKSTA